MEYIFEFLLDLLELVLEGGIEASKSRKVPYYIRYTLIITISLFFIAVIGIVFFVGILALKKNVFAGILVILIGLLLLIMGITKFRKTYLDKAGKSQN